MANRKQRVAELARAVEGALAELDLEADAVAYDGWLDPHGVAQALGGDEPVLLRVGGDLDAAQEGFAAVPGEPMFLRVDTDGGLRIASVDGDARDVKAARVRVDVVTEPCCDSAKCRQNKDVHQLLLELADGETLIVGESLTALDVAPMAVALATRVDVPHDGVSEEDGGDAAPAPPLSARALARWALRREGPLFVLRDHASLGPRESASREWIVTVVMATAGVGAWAAAYLAYRDRSYETLTITAAVAFVLTLAAYAMSHIAAHSARYRAKSEALLFASQDRFVLAPWHSRAGAVNTNPEGRYGAALRARDVERIDVVREEGGFTLRAHSTHGAYDIGTLESEEQARAWRAALVRLIERVSHHAAFALLALLLGGCGPAPVNHGLPPQASAKPIASAAPSMPPPSAAPAAVPPPEHGGKLSIVEDDLPKAMATAKTSGRAVFVEVWAPWCHTCLSMKNFVLPDPSIAALQDRVVFATIDSDRPQNEAFVDRYAVMVWPTLYVLDPTSGNVLGLWQGAASVKELRRFIRDSVDARDAKIDPEGPLSALIAAKRAHASASWKEAMGHYQQAVDRGGPTWARRDEAIAGLQFCAYRRGQWSRCAELGYDHVGEIQGAAVPADFAWVTLRCADEVKDSALAKKARTRAIARLKTHTEAPPAAASVDDKSDALSIYAGALRKRGDEAGARKAVEKQVALLEAAAAAAPGPAEASTFDYARMGAYLSLGRGDEAVAMLKARAEQLPDSYEPVARLAQALIALKRYDEATAPMAAAVAKAYGPRKLRYLKMQADLALAKKDVAAEKASLAALVAHFDTLSATQRKHPPTKRLADQARKRLAEL